MTRVIAFAAALALAALSVAGAPAALFAGDVHVGVNIGVPVPPPPAIVLPPYPHLVIVPGTPVYYSPDVSFNFFAYDGRYYTLHDGAWFVASSQRGPWRFVPAQRVPRPVLAVPVAYYKVPPGHAKKMGGGPPPRAGHGPAQGHGRGPKAH